MKGWKSLFIILFCLTTLSINMGGCSSESVAIVSDNRGLTETEKSKVSTEHTELGDIISLYDEEIGDTYEINVIKSSSYHSDLGTSLYLIQGTTFQENQLTALKAYLDTNAPQTLLAIMNNGDPKKTKRDFVKKASAYGSFLLGNVFVWLEEYYSVRSDDICFVGYETAGYFGAYLLYTDNRLENFLMINPELQNKTNKLDIVRREENYYKQGNKLLPKNICLLRSEDDQNAEPYRKSSQWISILEGRSYKGLRIQKDTLPGTSRYVLDCEALLRGICYFSGKVYGEREASCVTASKAMTQEEQNSITVGRLSEDHEYYADAIAIDPAAADYIKEISIYDEEIDDRFIVHISLPPDYEEGKDYPLVLMTDGVWRLTDHPELHKQMETNEIENVILASVGYPNTYDDHDIRTRDLLYRPDLFLQFLVDNLVPYLSDNYSIDNSQITLAGHSIGGYFELYALFHNDTIGRNTFANYYIGSPTVNAGTDFVYVKDFEDWYYDRNQSLNCSVYVTVGGEEEADFIDEIEGNVEYIKNYNFEGLSLEFEVIEGYNHNTVFKPSIKNALERFYGIP